MNDDDDDDDDDNAFSRSLVLTLGINFLLHCVPHIGLTSIPSKQLETHILNVAFSH